MFRPLGSSGRVCNDRTVLGNLCLEYRDAVLCRGDWFVGIHLFQMIDLQVMPTQLRGQGTAFVNVMSMVSQMASPYIVYSVGEN